MAPFLVLTLVAGGCGEAFSDGGAGGGGGGTTLASSTGADGVTSATSSASTGPGGPACIWNSMASPVPQCMAGLYCNDPTCGAGEGACALLPQPPSPSRFKPFCGCDGVTYMNAGYAASKKMSGKPGYCPAPGDETVCLNAGGIFVEHSAEDMCGENKKICLATPYNIKCGDGALVQARSCTGDCVSLCDLIKAKKGFGDQTACN